MKNLVKMLMLSLTFSISMFLVACGSETPTATANNPSTANTANTADSAGTGRSSGANNPSETNETIGISDFVGVWGWESDEIVFQLHFREDGTGMWTGIDADFNWEISGDELTLNLVGTLPVGTTVRNQRWQYVMDGGRLTITSLQVDEEWVYFRMSNEPLAAVLLTEIVGVWGWDSNQTNFQLHFNEDGSGEWLGVSDNTFNWATVGGELHINWQGTLAADTIRNERWIYSINGDNLLITSLQDHVEWLYIRQ
ncbi:MAG: hypothetical protein FWG64_03415 [Firmicutes bacterium]|nr:hypothetical protein [Bacillota bacterium]